MTDFIEQSVMDAMENLSYPGPHATFLCHECENLFPTSMLRSGEHELCPGCTNNDGTSQSISLSDYIKVRIHTRFDPDSAIKSSKESWPIAISYGIKHIRHIEEDNEEELVRQAQDDELDRDPVNVSHTGVIEITSEQYSRLDMLTADYYINDEDMDDYYHSSGENIWIYRMFTPHLESDLQN